MWPTVVFEDDRLVQYLGATDLHDIRPAELCLARAAAGGNASALRAFQRLLHTEAAPIAVAQGLDPDEIGQKVWIRLFVPGQPGAAPRIDSYTGRGTLRNWVRVIAARICTDQHRRGRSPPAEVEQELLAEAVDSPELWYIKTLYRDAFRQAFAHALAQLTPAERNLLRLRVVHNLKITEIGALRGIHAATVKRRLARVRSALDEGTRAAVQSRLDLDPSDVKSVLRLIQSRMEVSIRQVLGEQSEPV